MRCSSCRSRLGLADRGSPRTPRRARIPRSPTARRWCAKIARHPGLCSSNQPSSRHRARWAARAYVKSLPRIHPRLPGGMAQAGWTSRISPHRSRCTRTLEFWRAPIGQQNTGCSERRSIDAHGTRTAAELEDM
eukprot:scaffold23_cov113-Isochrysis_galbana.AAC.8